MSRRQGLGFHRSNYRQLFPLDPVQSLLPRTDRETPSIMADPDFNSSDIEFDAEPDPFDHYGARSIEAMFESRHEDRVATKKRMANLKDTKGAPNTVAFRALWMKRFEAYMTRIRGLRYDISPPTSSPRMNPPPLRPPGFVSGLSEASVCPGVWPSDHPLPPPSPSQFQGK